jgi:hypothetical protein|tara:strand:+ start:567 stop:836 length:270 start_codon:yes stop_codon:yes gene_type:complete
MPVGIIDHTEDIDSYVCGCMSEAYREADRRQKEISTIGGRGIYPSREMDNNQFNSYINLKDEYMSYMNALCPDEAESIKEDLPAPVRSR